MLRAARTIPSRHGWILAVGFLALLWVLARARSAADRPRLVPPSPAATQTIVRARTPSPSTPARVKVPIPQDAPDALASIPSELPERAGPSGGVTLVVAYFRFNNTSTKHSHGFYLDAGKNVLSIHSPMVIFTNEPKLEELRERLAPGVPTLVRLMRFDELETVRTHLARLDELLNKDPESSQGGQPHERYSASLFALYHAKPEMVAAAARLNPFGTRAFLWVDVGSLRDYGGVYAKDYVGKVWPAPSKERLLGRNGKVLMSAVGGRQSVCGKRVSWVTIPDTPAGPRYRRSQDVGKAEAYRVLEVPETPMDWWIAGALFGGAGKDVLAYYDAYKDALAQYLGSARTTYSLIDQYTMGVLACTRPDLVEVVRPPEDCCSERVSRQWFFLYMYLGEAPLPTSRYSDEELAERAKRGA